MLLWVGRDADPPPPTTFLKGGEGARYLIQLYRRSRRLDTGLARQMEVSLWLDLFLGGGIQVRDNMATTALHEIMTELEIVV